MNRVAVLLAEYRDALNDGADHAPIEDRRLFALHKSPLDELTVLLSSGGSAQAIARAVAGERRALGWSCLPDPHGERVESAFHALASVLEQYVKDSGHGASPFAPADVLRPSHAAEHNRWPA